MRKPLISAVWLAVSSLVINGCASNAIKENQTTFLTKDDMIRMTDQMAQEIVASDYLKSQPGPLKIVIEPVINRTSEIIPGNRAQLFVARLRGLLAQEPALRDRFMWLMNRDDFQKLRASEIPASEIGPSETEIAPEYVLYAQFMSDTDVTTKTRSDTYLCQYYITAISGPDAGKQLWAGQYQTSKHVKKGFLD